MRVLFLVTAYPSEKQPVGGIFHKTQAEALQRLGVVVDVVAPVPLVPFGLHLLNGRWREYRTLPRRCLLDGVRIERPRYVHWPLRLYIGKGADAPFARAVTRILAAKPDVVHAHFAYPPGLAATRLVRKLGVPSVLTLHGSDVNVLPEINRTNRARFSRAVTAANAVVAVSQALADRTEVLTGRRPMVLPIGIKLGGFRKPACREIARRSIGVPIVPPVVAYVGKLARSKGVVELLEAMKRLVREGVQGIVVGDGPLRPEVQAAVGVHYYGQQPNERMPLFMSAADVLVLPSYSEGLPTVLVEAGAVGTPVIATAVGGTPEILGQGRGILIPPGSVDALLNAIQTVLGDRRAAANRAARLSRHVEEVYDADKNAARLVDVYRGLL